MSEVTRSLQDGILTLSLNRPEKKNALTQGMYAALAEAIGGAGTGPAVRVILIRGEGPDFCAGNDIGDFAAAAMGGAAPGDLPAFRLLEALARLDKPVVAAVRGRAVGIGVTLLLHCDLVVVGEDARLSVPFVNLALAPEAASSLLLPAAIGHRRAFEMFALGEAITGAEAAAWGLANRAVPDGEVDAAAARFAEALAARAPGSLAATKRLMRDGEQIWALMQREGEVFGERLRSAEALEAFTALMQKRPPSFAARG